MSILGRGTASVYRPLASDELIDAISRLLVSAGTTLEIDLLVAKRLIDQASALIDWRAETKAGLASIETHAQAARGQALAPWQVKRLTDFVAINMASQIRNDDLAATVGLSPSHLQKAFKRSFGVTPKAYVVQYRVQQAKHLMLSTDEQLVQIGLACGFADQAHFSTSFRRVTGITPAQWRRTYKEY
jgi:AraC-like DNA-binding protein